MTLSWVTPSRTMNPLIDSSGLLDSGAAFWPVGIVGTAPTGLEPATDVADAPDAALSATNGGFSSAGVGLGLATSAAGIFGCDNTGGILGG